MSCIRAAPWAALGNPLAFDVTPISTEMGNPPWVLLGLGTVITGFPLPIVLQQHPHETKTIPTKTNFLSVWHSLSGVLQRQLCPR